MAHCTFGKTGKSAVESKRVLLLPINFFEKCGEFLPHFYYLRVMECLNLYSNES